MGGTVHLKCSIVSLAQQGAERLFFGRDNCKHPSLPPAQLIDLHPLEQIQSG